MIPLETAGPPQSHFELVNLSKPYRASLLLRPTARHGNALSFSIRAPVLCAAGPDELEGQRAGMLVS